jgi:L-fuconolactonase
LDIFDAQLHFGPVGSSYGQGPLVAPASIIDSTLEAMNSLGIQSALLEEYWYWVTPPKPLQNMPGFELPNGAWRATFPLAQLAATLHPDRFSNFVRVDRRDPDLEAVMRLLAQTPCVRAFRVLPVWSPEEGAAFKSGGFDEIFAIAESLGLPMCMPIPGYVEWLPRYLKKFPKLQFVLDHWGMGMIYDLTGRPQAEVQRAMSLDYLDEIMKLAEFPNIVMKISHAQMYFNAPTYPFEPIRPILRRAIDTFGVERILWSTDKTVAHPPLPWAELLHFIKDNPELSQPEKEAILGKNARRVFKWPAPAAQ